MSELTSVREIFHNFIVLRDLEPYQKEIPGLSALRQSLGIPDDVTPRKNEIDYARVIEPMLRALSSGQAENCLYFGDTPFTDGSVIRNLSRSGTYRCLGLICHESEKEWLPDVLLKDVVLCNSWARVDKVLKEAVRRGFDLDHRTVALFDLDNTVYSARGRSDQALRNARLAAVQEIVRNILGVDRYEEAAVDRVYREFDRDFYHALTGDNQDYVLVLSVCCLLGVSSVEEIKREFLGKGNVILSFIERCRDRIQRRKNSENLVLAWEFLQEVYFNARQNDPTPCKMFRQREYLQTLKRMTDSSLPDNQRIVLTREIVELVEYLRGGGVKVIAFSDKPAESAEDVLLGQGRGSIFDVPLPLRGTSILSELQAISRRQ